MTWKFQFTEGVDRSSEDLRSRIRRAVDGRGPDELYNHQTTMVVFAGLYRHEFEVVKGNGVYELRCVLGAPEIIGWMVGRWDWVVPR